MQKGQSLGFAADQFLRYYFDVASFLTPTRINNLTLTFSNSSDPRLAEGRVTGAGGGWDWGTFMCTLVVRYVSNNATRGFAGPIASLVDGHPDDRVMSRGIIRSVYLLEAPQATPVVVQIVPLVYYAGTYPTTPLTDATAGPFTVDTAVYLLNPHNETITGTTLLLEGSWGGGPSSLVHLPPLPPGIVTRVNASLAVPIGAVKLWWTADTSPTRGPQALYRVTATLTTSSAAVIQDSRDIGFRVFTLVTGNDTTPALLSGVDGSGNLTMRFRLNGANLYARGADIIPMECK